MMNQMMKGMMDKCCDSEGKPNFEKMKDSMENCGCFSTKTDEGGETKGGEAKAGTQSCGGGKAASTGGQNR